MKTLSTTLKVLTCAVFIFTLSSLAQAQATRTWVSGVGDDVNPCSRTAPCKTFAGAISKTATNGEINALDAGGFGAVTIVKSITIDGGESFASILAAGTTGTLINFTNFAGTDTRKTVRLRNLQYNGANTGLQGIRVFGGAASAGSEVSIENVVIDGFFGSPGIGIEDERTGGGKLSIVNTVVRNNGGTGITIQPASGSTRLDVVIDNVHADYNNFGIAASSGSRVTIFRSVAHGNTNAGFFAESLSGTSELQVDGSVSSSNGTGVQQAAGATIRLSNNTITFNATGVTGTTFSYGNNRLAGNTAPGTAPTAIGGASSVFGQQ